MIRKLAVFLACVPLMTPRAHAQTYTGTYTLPNQTGGVVTLMLQQDAQGKVTGTLSGNGDTFQIQGQVNGTDLVGLATGGGGGVYLEARLEGAGVHMILVELGPGNQPRYDQARELMFTRQSGAGAPAGGAPSPAGPMPKAPAAPAMTPQDVQVSQLLLSSRWCHFSYSGVSGSSSGSSYTETVVFSPDGGMVVQTGGESYYSADVRNSTGDVIARGSTAGQQGGGQQYRWRVSQGMLMTSTDGMTWQPTPLQITQNSNGYPIITANGKEYSQCR